MAFNHFYYRDKFVLESGRLLSNFQLGYTAYGTLNAEKNNVVWIFHALTANSDPAEWWPSLVGKDKLFDPAYHFIICVNMPGSCYGSTGPLDIDPQTRQPFYHDFPVFTTRDMVRAYRTLQHHLGISKIRIGIGGSMGGQQLLEWAIEDPDLFENIFPIATNAVHSPWGKAFNASQRMCIEADATWQQKNPDAGRSGMKAARSVALLSYRHYDTYLMSQSEENQSKLDNYKSDSYQRYQGEKLSKRFNAFSYYFLSKSMDAHNLARGRKNMRMALATIKAKTTVIGIETDLLFPLSEQQFLAENIPDAEFSVIRSDFGHDGFLIEHTQIEELIAGNIASAKNIVRADSV